MSAEALVTTVKAMKLHGMAGDVGEFAEQGAHAFKQPGALLDNLVKAKVAEREVRSFNYQMKIAGPQGTLRLRLCRELGRRRSAQSAAPLRVPR